MKSLHFNRRKFIREAAATAAGLVILPTIANAATDPPEVDLVEYAAFDGVEYSGPPRIKFSVIGINHGHIYSQVEAVLRGGGEFVSFHAKEPDLAQAFAKRFPQVKQVQNEKEILEDK